MNLIIDIGNTQTKIALINQGNVEKVVVEKEASKEIIEPIIKDLNIELSIISSVKGKPDILIDYLKSISKCIFLSEKTSINFKNLYKTPHTLGKDRIALVAAAQEEFLDENVLIIDTGTCITFDFKSNKGVYLGGSISLGLEMRFKALNHFTANLPLVGVMPFGDFIGDSTESSILSGVINGVRNEVDGVINQYKQRYENLKVIITGGDQLFFAECLKNNFFARPYFILKGLDVIARINA